MIRFLLNWINFTPSDNVTLSYLFQIASVDFPFYIKIYSVFEITIIIQQPSWRAAAAKATMRLGLSNFANVEFSYVLRSPSINKNDNATSNYLSFTSDIVSFFKEHSLCH